MSHLANITKYDNSRFSLASNRSEHYRVSKRLRNIVYLLYFFRIKIDWAYYFKFIGISPENFSGG